MSALSAPIEVFYSYTHKDEPHLQDLHTHLSMLKREGCISTWHDRQITPGTDWAQAINTHVETASLILLLVSADFLASDYCYEIEMQRALQRHEAGGARVIPILVRPCDWSNARFARLQCLPSDGKAITIWNNRDLAWKDVTAGIRQAIKDLTSLSAIPPRATFPPVWNIPYSQNPFFTGRNDILLRIHTLLQTDCATAISQPQAISGLGGIGKTQVAVEYAYQHRQDYQAVLWARAESTETLVSSYLAIAELLNLPEKDAQDQSIAVQAVKAWLQSHGQWLLILDSADDLTLVPPFLPPVIGGHLLLTTRAQAMGRLASRIEVETFSAEQGMLFLLRRAALLASDASLERVSIQDRELATQITQELGGLPLALDQAGAYLEETGSGLLEYLQIYQQHRVELLKERRGLVDDHPEPVATTWALSFARVEEKCPAAADLLRLCAFLDPDAIPLEIITRGATHLGPQLAPIARDTYLLGQAIEALRAYSLVGRDRVARTLSLHRLVQAVVRETMPDEEAKQWMQRVVSAVNVTLADVRDFAQWTDCERCLPHALLCAIWIEQEPTIFPDAARLLNQTAYYLHERAQYAEAESLYRRALEIREKQLGADHPDTATSLNNLAALYDMQGKFAEAEPLLKRALEIREMLLDTDHPDTALSLSNLALLYQNQGKFAEAEPLLKRALEIREMLLEADHPDAALSLSNLALLYQNQGKFAEAEPLYRRALEIREKQLGADHPSTAISLNNLAMLCKAQGKFAEAEPSLKRALKINEKQLGANHPSTATSLNNLALLYQNQGKFAEAEPLYRRALEIREKQLGANHPSTATSLNNLAMLYQNRGKFAEAEPLLKRAFEINKLQLGANHPSTATSLSNLAMLYQNQGKFAEAEPLLKRALEIREMQLDTDPPNMAANLNNLALLYQNQGKFAEAEPLYRQALEIREKQLGANHPSTATSLNNLAMLCKAQGKFAEAEPLLKQAFSIREKQLGINHPDTARSLTNLAGLYHDQGKFAEAEPLYRQALETREKQLGVDHPDTARSLTNLAGIYHDQGKFAEAEPLYKRALETREKQLGIDHSIT